MNLHSCRYNDVVSHKMKLMKMTVKKIYRYTIFIIYEYN